MTVPDEAGHPDGVRIEPTLVNGSGRSPDESAPSILIREKILGMARPAGWFGEGSGGITPEACRVSIDFLARAQREIEGLEDPRVGPSSSGAVALQWDFDEVSLVVRISAGPPSPVHFQEEGPGFHVAEGLASSEDVLVKLGQLVRNHVLH